MQSRDEACPRRHFKSQTGNVSIFRIAHVEFFAEGDFNAGTLLAVRAFNPNAIGTEHFSTFSEKRSGDGTTNMPHHWGVFGKPKPDIYTSVD